MDRESALAILREHRPELAKRRVARAALFGSVARGDAGPDSDVDVLIEFEPEARVTIYDYVAIKRYIAEVIGGPVDVIEGRSLKKHIRAEIEADAVYAF